MSEFFKIRQRRALIQTGVQQQVAACTAGTYLRAEGPITG